MKMAKIILGENEQLLNQWIEDLMCFDINLDGQLYACNFVGGRSSNGYLKLDNHFIKLDKPLFDIWLNYLKTNNKKKNDQLLSFIDTFSFAFRNSTRNAKIFSVKSNGNKHEHEYMLTFLYTDSSDDKHELASLKIIDLDTLEEIFEGEQEDLVKSNVKDNIKHKIIDFITAQNVLQELL